MEQQVGNQIQLAVISEKITNQSDETTIQTHYYPGINTLNLESFQKDIDHIQVNQQVQQDFSLRRLKLINQTLREESIARFLPIYQNALKLASLMRHWQLYEFEYKSQTLQFLNLISLKAAIFGDIFYFIFEGLKDLTSLLNAKIQESKSILKQLERYKQKSRQYSRDRAQRMKRQFLSKIQDVFKVKINPLDKLFLQILQEKQAPDMGQRDLILQRLFSQMAQEKEFQDTQDSWIRIFGKLDFYGPISQKKSIQNSFLENIQNEKMMNVNCLGCMRFAYDKASIKGIVNKTPVTVFPNIHKIRQIQTQLKEKISAYMNTGGGIILFNCKKEFFNIKVQGTRITEKEKEAYQQVIISFLPSFYPRLVLNQNIVISFVPLVSLEKEFDKNAQQVRYKGEEGWIKHGQTYYQREYLQGFYVCRIKISPFEDRKICLWIQNEGIYQNFHLNMKSNSNAQEPIKNLRKNIKRNIRQNYIDKDFNQLYQITLKTYSYFDHNCSSPQAGIIISSCNRSVQQEESINKSVLQHSFDNMSLIIVKSKHLQTIKQKLKRYGKNVYLDRPFTSYNFKPALHTAVLYHNIKFEALLKEVCFNRQYECQGKNLLAINVTPFLKLKNCTESNLLSIGQFQNIQSWLHLQFPKQNVKIWEFKNKQNVKEYYLETKSKLSTLFLYYTLRNFGDEVTFKCPLGLDKMSEEQRRVRFRDITGKLRQPQYQGQSTQIDLQTEKSQNNTDFHLAIAQVQFSLQIKNNQTSASTNENESQSWKYEG